MTSDNRPTTNENVFARGKTPRVLPARAHESASSSRALCQSRRAKLRVLHAVMWDPCQPGKTPATHNTSRSRYLRSLSPATSKTPCRQNPKIPERQIVLPKRPAREPGKTPSRGGTDSRPDRRCLHAPGIHGRMSVRREPQEAKCAQCSSPTTKVGST